MITLEQTSIRAAGVSLRAYDIGPQAIVCVCVEM